MPSVKYLFCLYLLYAGVSVTLTTQRRPLVFVLCLKGLRWDLPYFYPHLPHFRRLTTTGARALWMETEFGGSQTNILSLMSGLHVEDHARRDFIETIPVVNEHVGGHTRLLFWPWFDQQGNQQAYEHLQTGRKRQPEVIESYSHHGRMSIQRLTKHLTSVLDSLANENDRTNLVMSFIDEPFATLKEHGIHSTSIRRTMLNIDRLIGRLLSVTAKHKINLIVLGDHGIEPIGCRQAIYPYSIFSEQLLNLYSDRFSGTSFSFVIYPKSAYTSQILLNQLRNLPKEQVEIHSDDQGHLSPKLRLPTPSGKPSPIIIFAKEKFYFSYNAEQNPASCSNEQNHRCSPTILADHSDDPRHLSMRTALFAHGPLFRKGHINEPVLTTDVYALLRQALCLSPIVPPRDGLFPIHRMLDLTTLSNACARLYLSNVDMLRSVSIKAQQERPIVDDNDYIQLVYVNITERHQAPSRDYIRMRVIIE